MIPQLAALKLVQIYGIFLCGDKFNGCYRNYQKKIDQMLGEDTYTHIEDKLLMTQ